MRFQYMKFKNTWTWHVYRGEQFIDVRLGYHRWRWFW